MLAVHPAFGGSWWSQLRPSDLRSYDGDPMTWTGFTAALTDRDTWAFEISLYIKDGLTGQVFNNQSQTSLKLYDDLVSSGEASFYLRNYVTLSEWTGWHTVRLEVRDGNASLYLDGELKASKPTGLTIPFTQNSVTDANIGIGYARLENPDTGTVLWQSNYKDTHAVYTPRDFSAGYQWTAVGAALRNLPWTSDYHFKFDFTVPDEIGNGSYWLMYQSNGRVVFTLDKDARGCRFTFGSFSFVDGPTVYTPFQPSLAGRHVVTLSVVGTKLRIELDDATYEQTGERVTSSEYDHAVTTTAPVTFHSIELVDDTASTELWHATQLDFYLKYPALPWPYTALSPAGDSEAERLSLIRKNNIRTDQGGFEAEDHTVVSSIDTQLDLRGTPVTHTLIASSYFPMPENDGLLHYFPLITQGAALDGAGNRVTVGLIVTADYCNSQSNHTIQVLWSDGSGALHSVSKNVDSEFFGKRHLIAATMRANKDNSTWVTELYADGVQLIWDTGALTNFVFGNSAATTIGVNNVQLLGRVYTGFLSQSNKLDYAVVLNRVLSPEAIAALTPGTQA